MNRAAYLFFVLAAVVFVAGMLTLFNREVASGEAYPEYSSLRTDPDGAKLLYDSLARLPGVKIGRNFLPISSVQENEAAIFVIGIVPERFDHRDDYLRPLQALAREGNRVVVALRYEPGLTALRMPELEKAWGVKCATDRNDRRDRRGHPFYFAEAKGWTPVDSVGAKVLAIEREFGRGSIVLAAESGGFVNDAVLAGRNLPLISRAVGQYRRIIFDESHLGIAQSGSVVGLARRFHLTGLAMGLGICAILFLWKSVPVFPPPAASRASSRSGITSQAGLVTLLRRHIPAEELASICWRAWLETNRHAVSAERISRAEAILRETASEPSGTLRRIGAALQSKGEF